MGLGLLPPINIFSAGASYTNSGYMNAYSGALGTVTGFPSGSQASLTYSQNSYVNGSYAQTAVLSLGLNDGNFGAGGVVSVGFENQLCSFQVSFSPAIPKDATKVLTLNASISWSRSA